MSKDIRRALMVAKGVTAPAGGVDRQENLARHMEGNHPLVPNVLYHGTTEDIRSFRPSQTGEFGPGIYLTDLPEEAADYAGTHPFAGKGPNIMPVHLSMKNPFVVKKDPDEFWGRFGGKTDAEAMQNAIAAGHDGVIFKRPLKKWDDQAKREVDVGKDHTHYVAFDPKQVKSATGNQGTFDPTDPDITKARGGSVHPATQIPGVHISERTHGRPVFAEERVGKAGGGSVSPKKTVKAYKLFRTIANQPGKLFPLFVDANTPVPMGKWVEAKAGDPGKTDGKVKSNIGDLAYRPGWHAGDVPVATHIGKKSDPDLTAPDYRPDNHVWAEVEMAADKDWQSIANARARRTKAGEIIPNTAHITDQVPLKGFYRYKTNPNMTGNWLIGGHMKVNRVLPDDEVKKINDAAGVADLPRRKDPEGFADGGTVPSNDIHVDEGITAYQGGPHSVGPEGYSNDKIGTGEGAQVYGYGHYFAEHEPVAQQYRDQLSAGTYKTTGGELFDPTTLEHRNLRATGRKGIDEAIDQAKDLMTSPGQNLDLVQRDLNRLLTAKTSGAEPHVGHMHQVRIQGRPEHFLDWDRPLSEQSDHVRTALEGAGYTKEEMGAEDPLGSQIYKRSKHVLDHPKVASEELSRLGIRGIRYLDQQSRNNYLVKDAPDGTANMTDRHGKVISNHPTRQEAHQAGKEMGSRNYVVFDPKHIDIQRRYARGGMAYADGGSTPDAGVQKALDLTRDLNPQGLYSHAAEAATASPQAKGPLPQMLASLKGVKPDELKYSGVQQAFADKPRVTREELAGHFSNALPVIREAVRETGGNPEPKYQRYTLPGGENYREVIMHLTRTPGEVAAFVNSLRSKYGDKWVSSMTDEEKDAKDRLLSQTRPYEDYRHDHWPQRNVVAHLRLKDRTGPNGEKILHAEEIQSDWGQAARREGTYNSQRPYQVFEANTGKVLSEHARPEEAEAEALKHRAAGNEGVDHGHVIDTQTDKEPVPDAPYIGNTQNWTDLALKRLLHEAAAGGYDKVVYTPGAEQAKRYGKGDSDGMDGYYDKIVPKSLLALARQHDPDAQLEAHGIAGLEKPPENKSEEHQLVEAVAGIPLSHAQVEALHEYHRQDRQTRGDADDAFDRALEHAMRVAPDKSQGSALPGLTITPRMRESILKRGFKAYARGGDVEGTMRIAKAGGGPLGDDEAVKKALALTAQAQVPAPQQAVQTARRLPVSTPAVNPASPLMQQAFQAENRPGIVVSPRPGKGSGPPITREMPKTVPDIYSKFPVYSDHPDLQYENEPWNPSTPNLIGAPRPSPVQEPVRETPRMKNVTRSVQAIFKTKGFNDLIEDLTKTETSPGIRNLQVAPIQGTWKKELEPSFIIHHPDMTDAHAAAIAPVLGFGKQQDATIRTEHNPSIEDGIPAALIGHSNGISEAKLRKIAQLSGQEGLDFSQTKNGKAVKYLHFGEEHEYPEFLDKVNRIADAAGLPERGTARAESELINAKDYLPRIFGENSSGEGVPAAAKRSPDLFRRIVDHVLAPYAKAIAGEGYRLSPERLQETYGLTDEETDHVRKALYPGKKGDRTTVPLMTGEEELDVRPTGGRGQPNVNDVMYALQNRAARLGQIDPGDFSDTAKNSISKDIASEVAHHVNNSDKSAIGWYDKALKAAMDAYSTHFPQLKTDPDKQMLFHALLGITSQGQNVHENSGHAVRLFDLMENQGMTLPQAVDRLEGTFGDKTRAIEHNLLKFDHLVKNNGYDKMRDVFNQKMSVGEWRKKLREDPSLYDLNGKPFSVAGKSNQQVTGWSVFGPKIGSFINNLHGDYSTLTADLWYSRTWNRLLGHNFMHTPSQEADQYRDFRDALKAERMHSPAAESLSNPKLRMDPSFKTSDGKPRIDPATGKPKSWLYGDDAKKLSEDDYQKTLGDPEAMLELAKGLHKEFKDSGYKDKSDLRRRAKNWIENRENSVAAPRSDNERGFQQETVEQAQKLLKEKYGLDISVADIQAALWFHEKELFGKYGVASEKAQPADYADAARGTLDLIRSGNLFNVQSKEPKAPKKARLPKKADGGTVDAALRLVSQYGQPLPDAVNLARQHTRGRP